MGGSYARNEQIGDCSDSDLLRRGLGQEGVGHNRRPGQGFEGEFRSDSSLELETIEIAGVQNFGGGYVLTHSAIRPSQQWDATAGWAGPYTNGANNRPIGLCVAYHKVIIA